ncbi:type II secretion system protein [Neobacillus sp. DY30]|uniref:type IV pilus modification PilV family protein n=1 Tax=Neobacillus sp. DY30 TaxID=3047871 RepID=UPI0024C0C56C|nr:type II secretion system protein [Neobacillus sp. DY30]WHX99495.1 type II secretion system protein [Neobacillus sp. DY30]
MNEKGLTLIEVLASIVILSIIGVSLLTFFVQSARSNNLSKTMMDSTYVAQTQMEEINNYNQGSTSTTSISMLGQKLINSGSYTRYYDIGGGCTTTSTSTFCYGKTLAGDKRYVDVKLSTHSAEIGKVLLKVYKDSTKTKQEAQMEMFIPWKK